MKSLFIYVVLMCVTSIVHAQISLARYFDENSLPLLDLSDHLPVNFKWDQKGTVQVALNEGLNFLDENKLELAIANLSEAIELDSTLWVAYYYRGVVHKKKGELKEAETDLLHAKEMKIDQSEICFELGELYHQQGKYTEAEKLYEEAIHLNNNQVDAHFNLGSLYLMQADPGKALEYYKKCNEANPRFAKAYVMEGLLNYRGTKDSEASIQFFTKAIEMDSSNSLAYFWRGMFYVYSNQNEKCLEDWTRYITFNPRNVFMLSMRGYLYIELNRFDEAFIDLRKALLSIDLNEDKFMGSLTFLNKQIDIQAVARYIMRNGYGLKDDAFASLKKGFCLLIAGKENEALDCLKRAEGIEKASTIYYLEAIVHEYLNNHPQALKYYDRALQYDNDIFEVHAKKCVYHFKIYDYKNANSDLDEMFRLQPASPVCHRFRGIIRFEQGYYEPAIADLSQAIGADTTDWKAIETRFDCYIMLNKSEEAKEDSERLLKRAETNWAIYNDVVSKYLLAKDTSYALLLCDRLTNQLPQFCWSHVKALEIYIAQKNWNDAELRIAKVMSLTTEEQLQVLYAKLYYYKGLIEQYKYHNPEKAIVLFNKCIKTNFDNMEARYALAKVYNEMGKSRKALSMYKQLSDWGFKDAQILYEALLQEEK
ncbi:MAG TPA: tetratricopeptide repeat protein [Chryseolinea sp.]|nr:tetratricopeptide repeat protein [Chryseolinea sp.]